MKTKYYTQAEFARICGVTRQAVNEAVKKKLIIETTAGIDPILPTNKKYRKNTKLIAGNGLRSIAAKKVKSTSVVKSSLRDKPGMVKVTVDGVSVDVPQNEFDQDPDGGMEDIAKRYMVARTSKIEGEDIKIKLGNARLRGELLDKEAVYDGLFLYLDKLNSNLERMAGTFLNDVGYKIINAEEVTADVRQEWIDGTLKQIDAAKKVIVKKLKMIAENQK